ncbi:MAG: GNAT family N-acetyltransferase [Candidatus Saccharimonadales bacterium]
MSAIEIRQPSFAELPGIIRLRYMVLDAPRELPFDPVIRDEDKDPQTIHMAAFDGSSPVSTLRIERHIDYGPYVRRMATAEQYLRRGLGRKVLEQAASLAFEAGVTQLTLHSRPGSEEFYERCGFMPTGEYNEDDYGKYPKMVRAIR